MKLRMIPYGYKVNNGKVEPDETERKIVQRIFHNYIIGKGLKTIADMLTSEEVPIFEGETVWSKNRIKRILVDERYIGSNGYPSIVDDNLFSRAQNIGKQKGFSVEPCSPLTEFLKQHVICGQCGEHYRRLRQDHVYGHWDCIGGCICEKGVTDKRMFKQIEQILNCVYQNRGLLLDKQESAAFERTPEIIRYTNEIGRMMDAPQPSFAATKSVIFECAAIKFKHCKENRFPIYTERVVKAFESACKDELMTFEFISEVVDAILINKSGGITVRFMNDAEVDGAEAKLCMSKRSQRE